MPLYRVILSVLFVLPVFADDKLTGKIEALPASGLIGNWTVAGRTVQVNAQTKIDTDEGRAIVGACVDVKGNTTGNALVARSIEVKEASKCAVRTTPSSSVEIEGVVEQLPAGGLIGDWKIGGVIVRVNAQTRIEQEGGPVSVGSCAEAEGTRNADGSLAASKIETKNGSGDCRGEGNAKPQIEFRGTVQTAPAQGSTIWTISGRRVNITQAANVTPRGRPLDVNMCVEIEGRLEDDGSVTASRAQILGSGVCTNGLDRQEDI
ncbi:MAG: hypothetical protein FJW38_22530, partial [Acidobacteria bacterium]|nr:hypothetical protein [Acidobacteriota bacterium]